MKKEALLLVGTSVVAVLVALALIRWLAPSLLGIPPDLQLVRVSKKVPPFYDNVFRSEDYTSGEFLLQDPVMVMRGRPLHEDRFGQGPHDVLGFRNRRVPNVADIVTIGDSQTYGNNAVVEENWPSALIDQLPRRPSVYNMSCGAWTGPHYLEMLEKAFHFRPRVVVVAFYTGNDPLGAFAAAYGSERWADLRLNPDLDKSDAPRVEFPAPPSDQIPVRFHDETFTVMTPSLRYSSNLPDDAAVATGWEILKEVVRRMSRDAEAVSVPLIVTMIPTKELVYAERVAKEQIAMPDVYRSLVESESHRIHEFAAAVEELPGVRYVDVVNPLQEEASRELLYPPTPDGHPTPRGYEVIAGSLVTAVGEQLREDPRGLLFVELPGGGSVPAVVVSEGYYIFDSRKLFVANGWGAHVSFSVVQPRDLANLKLLGVVRTVEPDKFGPEAILG